MRFRPAVLSVLAVGALALAGCSSTPSDAEASGSPSPEPSDLCGSAAPDGASLDAIDVTGDVGAVPEVTIDAPIEVPEMQRRVIVEGDGEPLEAGQYLDYAISAFDAETGDSQGEIGYEAGQLLPEAVAPDSIGQVTGCATIGSRILVSWPESTGADGSTTPAQVYVFDVLGVSPTVATGEDQQPQAGFPEVTTDDQDVPTVASVEGVESPETTELETLKLGDGAEVAEGDNVMVQYTGVKLSDGSVFDSSWDRGTPATFATTGVVQGFQTALVGQRVGSRVVAIIPPAEGYGVEGQESNELFDETLIFVVDILATQHAATG